MGSIAVRPRGDLIVFDANVLVYAADQGSDRWAPCRRLVERARRDPAPSFVTWSICYEFLRVATHPLVFRSPWTVRRAGEFVAELLASPGFEVLVATGRHTAALSQTMAELPDLRGSVMHDVHTAVLMREHGVSRICTADRGFRRFPFLTVVDPFLTAEAV